jgi:hypothetical protein
VLTDLMIRRMYMALLMICDITPNVKGNQKCNVAEFS